MVSICVMRLTPDAVTLRRTAPCVYMCMELFSQKNRGGEHLEFILFLVLLIHDTEDSTTCLQVHGCLPQTPEEGTVGVHTVPSSP